MPVGNRAHMRPVVEVVRIVNENPSWGNGERT